MRAQVRQLHADDIVLVLFEMSGREASPGQDIGSSR
jgi:hypothetical protein